jgi:hypothetical protein
MHYRSSWTWTFSSGTSATIPFHNVTSGTIDVLNNFYCTHKHKIEAQLHSHCCRSKASIIAYSECVCSLLHPACKARAPYYTVTLTYLVLTYFSTLFHKRHDFTGKNWLNIKHVFRFSLQLFLKNYHYERNALRHYQTCAQVFMQSIRHAYEILMKIEFSQQIFAKYWNFKYHENLSVGADLFHADWQTWQPKAIAFENFAYALKIYQISRYRTFSEILHAFAPRG